MSVVLRLFEMCALRLFSSVALSVVLRLFEGGCIECCFEGCFELFEVF